jgi:hypothetical protein
MGKATADFDEVDEETNFGFLRRREARIFKFEKFHFGRNRWISLRRLVDWGARNNGPDYASVSSAIHAGKFDIGGRSQILFVSPVVFQSILFDSQGRAIGVERENGKVIRTHFMASSVPRNIMRFSVSDFRAVDHEEQDKSILEAAYLSRFWIPRAVCERWLRSENHAPAWLFHAGSQPNKPKRKTGKYLLVMDRLTQLYPEGVPDHASRKLLRADLIDTTPGLHKSLDDGTLLKAITEYNESKQNQRE